MNIVIKSAIAIGLSITSCLAAAADMSKDEIIRILDKAVPQWDDRILAAASDTDPVAQLDFYQLAKVMRDEIKEFPPEGAQQLDDGVRALQIENESGKVRFVNRQRAWQYKRDADSRRVDPDYAGKTALETLSRLGIPLDELAKPLVRPQIAAGGKVGTEKPTEQYDMYSLVFVQRQINGLPVYQSDARVAINNYGEVQRMGIEWPKFSFDREARLRPREKVLYELADDILQQSPTPRVSANANLAYAKIGDDGTYVPTVVVAVSDETSPYQLVVRLTELANSPDKE